jgi:hypothetical protein
MFVMGLSSLSVGNIILGMNLGFVCGGPLFGWISEKSGMAMTGIIFFSMIGPAVFLQGLGMFMQAAYPDNAWSPKAFQYAFWICSACLLFVSILYIFTSDKAAASQTV